MELRHLRYFVAAAEELHFTRAAARLGIAQPPLTLQIRALEEEIGVRLFHRLPRGVALTDAGRILFEDARTILDQVGKAVLRSRLGASGKIGRVGVGFTVSASFDELVNGSLRAFRGAFDKVDLHLEEARSTDLMQFLQEGRIDAAFVRPPVFLQKGLSLQILSVEPMLAAVPVGHHLAGRRAVHLQDLATEAFILYPRATPFGLSNEIVAGCEAAGFSPNVVQQTPQVASAINLVASSLGVSIVPACMRRSRADAVRYLRLLGRPLMSQLGLAFRSAETSTPVQNFVNLVKERATSPRRGRDRVDDQSSVEDCAVPPEA
jgi:DNA-binding transcriptional LysR family regulator